MFCLEINTKIKGSKISGILFLNFHSWNCSRILENSFREFSFPGIKKSWKILSWKKIVLEFSQNNLYFPWNLQFWNFPFLEFSTPGILSWNFLFLESYFKEFSCYRGNDIYLKIKTELLRIYSEKPLDSYKKALTRQMTGLLSQLGYQIINDICTKTTKLDGCCCEAATMALWSMSLLVNIRAHISNMSFTKDT